MPIGPAKMPLMEHLGELRKRLFVVLVVVGLGAMVLYFFTEPIYRFVVAPVWPILQGQKPIATGWLQPMMVRFSLSIWSAVVVASPVIAWQTLAFFIPALRPKERKWVVPTFAAMVVLFVLGVVFCYTMILGPSFAWLADQTGDFIRLTPTAEDMLSVVEFFLLGFGVAFQTPVVVFYLVYFGVIPYATLRKNWRTVYVVIVVLSAMITPDFSPVAMGALSVAMIILYEISLALVRIVLARRIRVREAAAAAEED
jgi:sec-independent protein translocase protein TatC